MQNKIYNEIMVLNEEILSKIDTIKSFSNTQSEVQRIKRILRTYENFKNKIEIQIQSEKDNELLKTPVLFIKDSVYYKKILEDILIIVDSILEQLDNQKIKIK